MPAILIAPPAQLRNFLPPKLRQDLHELLPDLREIDPAHLSPGEFASLLAEAEPEILVTGWDTPPLPERPPSSLRYVCHLAGTVRFFLPRNYLEQGIKVTNWGNSISPTVAEMALMLTLNCLRRTRHFDQGMRVDGAWRSDVSGTQTLFGKRVGIHGFGNIARALIRLLQPFDVDLKVYSEPVPRTVYQEAGITPANSLEELFAHSQVLIELEGLTDRSKGSVTQKHFDLLGDGSVFINVGRGPVVEESALLASAKEGRIQVGLDVYHEEPLPADYPLRFLENVILYPHIAGATPDYAWKAGQLALDNLKAYLEDRPFLDGALTPQIYDRQT